MGEIVQSWVVPGRVVSTRRLVLAAALVVLNLLDVLLTRAVIAAGGVEANPLMAPLMGGLAAPLGLKAVVAGCAGLLLLLCPPRARVGESAVLGVVVLYCAIVVWNAGVLAVLVLAPAG